MVCLGRVYADNRPGVWGRGTVRRRRAGTWRAEPFVAAVGDVLTADRSVGTACDGSESGLGGKVCSGIEGLAWGLRRHQ